MGHTDDLVIDSVDMTWPSTRVDYEITSLFGYVHWSGYQLWRCIPSSPFSPVVENRRQSLDSPLCFAVLGYTRSEDCGKKVQLANFVWKKMCVGKFLLKKWDPNKTQAELTLIYP